MITASHSPSSPSKGVPCTLSYSSSMTSVVSYKVYINGTLHYNGPNKSYTFTPEYSGRHLCKIEAYETLGMLEELSYAISVAPENKPPVNPPSLRVSPSGPVTEGSTLRISWDAATDPENQDITYKLSTNYTLSDGSGGSAQIYSGNNLFYDYRVEAGRYKSIKFTLYCVDSGGAVSSGFAHSDTLTVIKNAPPTDPGPVSVTMDHDFREYIRDLWSMM